MEQFLIRYSLYVVCIVILAIWFGISIWLLNLERKLSRLEKEQEEVLQYVNKTESRTGE